MMFNKKTIFYILLVSVLTFVIGFSGVMLGSRLQTRIAYADSETTDRGLETARQIESAFRSIARSSVMSVVRIDAVKQTQGSTAFQKGQKQQTFGSGIIVEQDGKTVWILTNNHVTTGATTLTVTLQDNTPLSAELIGFDERTDLALLLVETEQKLQSAKIGRSSKVQVGDWAISVGNPFGFNGSVTVGIVSALGRPFYGRADATDYIQTDAAVNPGNSGGPLLNIEGEVIGINTWIASQTGANTGLSFAIPIDNAINVYSKLKEYQTVEYAWIGVGIKSLTDTDFRKSLGIDRNEGAYVTEVFENSPADKAKIRVGDIITAVDKYVITDANELIWTISKYEPDDTIRLTFYRADRKKTVTCELGKRPTDNNLSLREDSGTLQFLGALFSGIGMAQRQQYGLVPGQTGVVITSVESGTPASEYGLEPGDVVTKINTYEIRDSDGLIRFIEQSEVDGVELFYCYLIRRGREMILGVQR